ncbi:MAG: hypothetical protein II749_02685 [Clostridia bacterium]|nr:hypothetical protein [Clostridia bacterium]
MKHISRYMLMVLMLCIVVSTVLCGCKKQTQTTAPQTGGVTDRTDKNAPKEIASKDIEEFFLYFYLENHDDSDYEDGFYSFSIKKNDKDEFVLTSNELRLNTPVGQDVLIKLQDIIDESSLVKKNGIYRVTAGLPPEYQPCTLTVTYSSGEKLTFTEDNDPWAGWTQEMFTVLVSNAG